jgi:hypothetical protein
MTLSPLAQHVLLVSLASVQPMSLAITYNTPLQDGVNVCTSLLEIMRPHQQTLEQPVLLELGACTVMVIGVCQVKFRFARPARLAITVQHPKRLLKFVYQVNIKM